MTGLIDSDLGLCEVDTGLMWLEGGLGGSGLWNGDSINPPGTMITESGTAPDWVLSMGAFVAALDIDFVGDEAWDGSELAVSDILTCSRATPALTYAQTSAGALTSFAANTLRYTDLGLLVEESRINYCLYSQVLSNGAWGGSGLTIADDQIAAPDGTTTADKLTVTASPAFSSQPVTIASAAAATWSFYIKQGTAAFAWVDPYDGSNHRTYFDLVNGTVGTNAAGSTSTITALANGWYRIVIQRTAADVAVYATVGLSDADNNLAVTVGRTAYVWGWQVEQGAFATSYIPTTTTSVTRAVDAVTFASSAWQVDGRGTLYAETYLLHGPSASSGNDARIVGNAGLGGAATLLAISGDGGSPPATVHFETYNGNLMQVGNAVDPLDSNMAAIAYDRFGRSLCCNGGTVATDATAIGTGDDAPWEIGSQPISNIQCINGYIPRLAYWSIRLSNTDLVTLSSGGAGTGGEVGGATMITESVVVPDWVMSVGDFVAKVDIDFVGDEAWNGSELAISDILSCTRATPALTYAQTSAGALTSFAANTLRYTDLGLLVEPSRTNIAIRSQQLELGNPWSYRANINTIDADATSAPDGTTTAEKFTVTSTGSGAAWGIDEFSAAQFTITAAVWSWSIYAKAGTGGQWVAFDANDGTSHLTWFDLVNGVVGTSAAGNTATITVLAGGWCRISIARNSATTTGYLYVNFVNGDNTGGCTAGQQYYLWGAQLEQGNFPTSYIPTTSGSVTRSRDTVSYAQSLSVFTPADGTFYLQIADYKSLTNFAGGFSGSDTHTFGILTNGQWATIDQNVSTVALSGHNDATAMIAASYGGAGGRSQAISINGNAVGTGTASNDVVQFGDLYLNENGISNDVGGGYMPRFTYWDVQLTNADLVTLSNGDGGTGGVTGGATMITETDLTPSWVLSVGGFGADLDIDFVGDQAWDGASVAISSLLTCSRASPALTYAQTSTGALTSFAANTLRYTDLGLLVEEGRTNTLTYSQDFSNAAWNATNMTVAGGQLAPDGTTTANLLTATADNTVVVYRVSGVSSTAPATWSVYAKAGTATYIIMAASVTSGSKNTWFDIANGAVGFSEVGNAATITALANGWYRCTITRASGDDANGMAVSVVDANISGSVVIGHTAYLWGAQFEAGAFPTSYIPTTSASVTRDKDYVTGSFSWDVDGTAYAQFNSANLATSGYGRVLSSGGPSTYQTLILNHSGSSTLELYSSGDLAQTTNNYTNGTTVKVASAYDHNGTAITMDGATVGTNSTDRSSQFAAATDIGVGNGLEASDNGHLLNGYMLRLALWDVRLSNSNLVTLTS